MDHFFALTLDDDFIRSLTRSQYKAVSSWLRLVRRKVEPVVQAKVGSFLSLY